MSSSFYSQIGIPSANSTAIESNVANSEAAATNAATSATNSASSASASAASATSANAADVSATQSKNAAAASETNAASSAAQSATSSAAAVTAQTASETAKTASELAATNAATSETNAAASAASAAADVASIGTSVTDAATSATAAASTLETFQNQYLGASATAPTVDPDGSALDLGDLWFDTASDTLKVYASGGWVNAGSSVNGTSERQTYTATAGQTTFAVTYDAGFVDVWLNGVKLLVGTDFTATSGTNIVLASGAAVNDIVDIIAFGTFSLSTHYTKTDADARFEPIGGSGYGDSSVDTHLNQSSATSGQYLKWNGSDYAWDTVAAGYTDSDVDAHLLTAGVTLDATNDRLGVGTSSPTASIHAYDATTNVVGTFESGDADVYITLADNTTTSNTAMLIGVTGNDMHFSTSAAERMRIDASGNVGIGLTNPTGSLHISNSAPSFYMTDTTNNTEGVVSMDNAGSLILNADLNNEASSSNIRFAVDGSERMRIDGSTGDVSIGTTSSANSRLFVSDTHSTAVTDGATLIANSTLSINGNSGQGSDVLRMGPMCASGAYFIDVSNSGGNAAYPLCLNPIGGGNVLVGKTVTSSSTQGIALKSSGQGVFTSDGGTSALFNRKTSDGDIIELRKDGTAIGVIGVASADNFYIGGSTGDTRGIYFNNQGMLPATTNGALANDVVDIGKAGFRWQDIYATNGTISTSDANEKQDIALLTATEMLVAKRISALFKTFRWKTKVLEKGDNARTHTGVIAQDVQAAFTAEGLDSGNYSLFISNTWWEKDVEVAAVEADEENGIEAKDAYTRTDKYDTQEEAPEGATEVTSRGIRYNELLSFIGAATEQRLTNIETRLEALEAN
jgi:hypothetical protein